VRLQHPDHGLGPGDRFGLRLDWLVHTHSNVVREE
jgi:hypothetical protein